MEGGGIVYCQSSTLPWAAGSLSHFGEPLSQHSHASPQLHARLIETYTLRYKQLCITHFHEPLLNVTR